MTRGDLALIGSVALGGALGSASRYLVGVAIQSRIDTTFPAATLAINVTGSLLLGFILAYASGSAAISPELRLFLSTGFCGGYTTFSTFSYESLRLIEGGEYRRASAYIVLSLVLSLGAVLLGFSLARSALGGRSVG